MPSRPTVEQDGLRFRVTPLGWTRRLRNPFYVDSIHPSFRVHITRVPGSIDPWKGDLTFTVGDSRMGPGEGRKIGTVKIGNIDIDQVGDSDYVDLNGVAVPQPGPISLNVVFSDGTSRFIYSYSVYSMNVVVASIIGIVLLFAANIIGGIVAVRFEPEPNVSITNEIVIGTPSAPAASDEPTLTPTPSPGSTSGTATPEPQSTP